MLLYNFFLSYSFWGHISPYTEGLMNTDKLYHRYAAFILVVQFTSTILTPLCGYFSGA